MTDSENVQPPRKGVPLRGLYLIDDDGITAGLVTMPPDLADTLEPAFVARHRVGPDPDDPSAAG